MSNTQSRENAGSTPEPQGPKKAPLGFGDLRLREAEAERVLNAAAQKMKSPEALAHTREQMMREQINKIAEIVVKYCTSHDLLGSETAVQFKKRVLESSLVKNEVTEILSPAYARQDEKNPLAYDNEYQQPYNVVSTEYGFDLRPSQTLQKEKWQTQRFNMEDYIGELLPQFVESGASQKDALEESPYTPSPHEIEMDDKLREDQRADPVYNEDVQNMIASAKKDGTLDHDMIADLDGWGGLKGSQALATLTEAYMKISDPELSYGDYIKVLGETYYSKIKPTQDKAGNRALTLAKDGEEVISAQMRATFIGDNGRIPTDEEIAEAMEKVREKEAAGE